MNCAPTLRTLTAPDIPAAMALSSITGWNQTAADWSLLLSLNPDGCLAIECDGRVVATTTLICYENRLAWLGMVLTHPEYRRRGFARQLVERTLALATEKRMQSVKLDATEQGRPLYESLGFRDEQLIERWSGSFGATVGGGTPQVNGPLDYGLDMEAFGANRASVLKSLNASRRSRTTEDEGYAMWRPGSRAQYLGPCVARCSKLARMLIADTLGASAGPWYWDLLPANRQAVEIASSLGFHAERKLIRMVRGADVRGDESMIYAGGGFELG